MKTAWIALAAWLSIPCATASADVIGPGARPTPAPTNCPRGAQAIPGTHGMSAHCRPSECDSAEDCMGSMAPCEEIGLCVAQGMTRGATYPIAPRACQSDADCEGVSSHGDDEPRCEVRERCGGLPGPGHDRLEPPEIDVDDAPSDEEPPEAPVDEEPETEEITPIARESSGCGCRVPAPGEPAPVGLVALWLGVALRARRSCRARPPGRRSAARSRRSAPR